MQPLLQCPLEAEVTALLRAGRVPGCATGTARPPSRRSSRCGGTAGSTTSSRTDYLFVDGSHFKCHANASAEPVLAGWGVDTDGKPVFIGAGGRLKRVR